MRDQTVRDSVVRDMARAGRALLRLLLADMATHVIKIETQEHGGDRRRFASFIHGESA